MKSCFVKITIHDNIYMSNRVFLQGREPEMFAKLATKYGVQSPLEGTSRQTGNGTSALSPFSSSTNDQNSASPSPRFGSAGGFASSSAVNQTPTPSTPFGPTNTGTFAASSAPSPSPFGTSVPPVNPSPFGSASAGGPMASSPSPFGFASGSPRPFGAAGILPTASSFGNPSPSPFGSTAPSSVQGPQKLFNGRTARDLLSQFYQEKNPSKVAEVDKLLEKYKGNEESLFRNLAKKYQLDPSVFGLTAAAPTGFGATAGGTLAPAFGQSSTLGGGPSPFGQSSLGFGQPSSLGAGPSMSSGPSGGTTFGAGAAGGFGASSFGSLAQSSPSPFGGISGGGFGAAGAGFGSPPAPAFGSPTPFGAPRR